VRGFSPLDVGLGLLPGPWTPTLCERVVRLAASVPFPEVPAMATLFTQVTIAERQGGAVGAGTEAASEAILGPGRRSRAWRWRAPDARWAMLVVEARLKGAGMCWASDLVNPRVVAPLTVVCGRRRDIACPCVATQVRNDKTLTPTPHNRMTA